MLNVSSWVSSNVITFLSTVRSSPVLVYLTGLGLTNNLPFGNISGESFSLNVTYTWLASVKSISSGNVSVMVGVMPLYMRFLHTKCRPRRKR